MLSRTSVAALLALTLGLVVPGCGARPKTSGRRSPIQVPSRASDSGVNARATEKVVIATGLGLNPDEARSHLRRSAIEQVVGALVDAELRIENGEVIEEIISASRAYVSSFKELGIRELPSGLWEVRAKVGVQETQLRSRLVEAQIIDGVVDGQSLFARSLSRIDQAQDHEALITRALQDYPACALTLTVGELEVIEDIGEEWTVGVPITFQLDPDGWESCMAQLRGILDSVARRTERFSGLENGRFKSGPYRDGGTPLIYDKTFFPGNGVGPWNYRAASLFQPRAGERRWRDDEFYWAVPAGPRPGDQWELFVVPRRLLPAVALFSSRYLELTVLVTGSDGAHVASRTLPCPAVPLRSLHRTFSSESVKDPWIASIRSRQITRGAEGYLLGAAEDRLPFFVVMPNWMIPLFGGSDVPVTVTLPLALTLKREDVRRAAGIEVSLSSRDPEWTFEYHPEMGVDETIRVKLPSLER